MFNQSLFCIVLFKRTDLCRRTPRLGHCGLRWIAWSSQTGQTGTRSPNQPSGRAPWPPCPQSRRTAHTESALQQRHLCWFYLLHSRAFVILSVANITLLMNAVSTSTSWAVPRAVSGETFGNSLLRHDRGQIFGNGCGCLLLHDRGGGHVFTAPRTDIWNYTRSDRCGLLWQTRLQRAGAPRVQ